MSIHRNDLCFLSEGWNETAASQAIGRVGVMTCKEEDGVPPTQWKTALLLCKLVFYNVGVCVCDAGG